MHFTCMVECLYRFIVTGIFTQPSTLLQPANEVAGKQCFYTLLPICLLRGVPHPPPPFRTRKAGGTHPTGMMSNLNINLHKIH